MCASCTSEIDSVSNLVVLEDRVIFDKQAYTDSETLARAIVARAESAKPTPLITPCASTEMNALANEALGYTGLSYIVRSSQDPTCDEWRVKHPEYF